MTRKNDFRAGWPTLAASVLLIGAAAPARAGQFQFTTLAVPGTTQTTAYAISPTDQVVGTTVSTVQEGFVWSGGNYTTVPSELYAINDTGLALGLVPGNGQAYAVYTIATGVTQTQTLSVPGRILVAGIDTAGEVAGDTVISEGKHQQVIGFLDDHGKTQLLLPGKKTQSYAVAMNNGGQILLEERTGGASLYTNGKFKPIEPPGAVTVTPSFINDADIIGGVFSTANGGGPFLKKGSKYTLLDPGNISGFGPAGQQVGYFYTNNAYHGFVRHNGKQYQIDAPNASQTVIQAINARGSIIGYYENNMGRFYYIATCAEKLCTK